MAHSYNNVFYSPIAHQLYDIEIFELVELVLYADLNPVRVGPSTVIINPLPLPAVEPPSPECVNMAQSVFIGKGMLNFISRFWLAVVGVTLPLPNCIILPFGNVIHPSPLANNDISGS